MGYRRERGQSRDLEVVIMDEDRDVEGRVGVDVQEIDARGEEVSRWVVRGVFRTEVRVSSKK